jgi:N-acetylglutamate synthase-like GNAT family acetyltransferase
VGILAGLVPETGNLVSGGFRHLPGCADEHLGRPCDHSLGSQDTGIMVARAQWVDILPYATLASKERVNVTEIDGNTWFKVTNDKGRVLGFAGIAPIGRRKARIRAVWVRPDFRGRGIGDALSRACLDYGIAAKFEQVEILSWDKAWALRNGFENMGETQHGATRLVFSTMKTSQPQ